MNRGISRDLMHNCFGHRARTQEKQQAMMGAVAGHCSKTTRGVESLNSAQAPITQRHGIVAVSATGSVASSVALRQKLILVGQS
jgi:hypothetical protein